MKKFALIAIALVMAALLGCQQARDPKLPAGGDFVLQSADGPVDSRSFRGKVMLIYFGYTNCPDVCPASLAAGGQALNALTPEERKRVKLIMISVDPQRDSAERLKDFVPWFNPTFLGLRGDEVQIQAATEEFRVFAARKPVEGELGYVIDHSTGAYVFDPAGRLRLYVKDTSSVEEIASDIRLLQQGN